jgi:penicillin-binding protein 1A
LTDDNDKKAHVEIEEFFRQFEKSQDGSDNSRVHDARKNGMPVLRTPCGTIRSASRMERKARAKGQASGIAYNLSSGGATLAGGGNGNGGYTEQGGIKKRGRRRKKYRVDKKRIFRLSLVLLLALFTIFSIYVAGIIKSAPAVEPEDIYELLSESSILYDDQGRTIDNLYLNGSGIRTRINYDEMPGDLINAFIAIEDKTFWTHNGFNFVRIFGAIKESLTGGGGISGTSTITQQLARNLWLAETKTERTLSRKIREAYFSLLLEKKLTKEQIIEAYLNTISLGNRSYGVQAASQAYFSKDAQDLTLLECAALASLPKAPGRYALVQTVSKDQITEDDPNLLVMGDEYAYVYNDAVESRKDTALKLMLDQNLITSEAYTETIAQNLRDSINPSINTTDGSNTYFADYVVTSVVADLVNELGYSEEDARQMVYTGGLKIQTTIDVNMQKIIESEFSDNANFPTVTGVTKDKEGNIIGANGKVLLYSYENYFDENGSFIMTPAEYTGKADGSLVLFPGKRLNFYKTEIQGNIDYSIEFKDIYSVNDGMYYTMRGGVIPVPAQYKSKDENGNLIIDGDFLRSEPAQDTFRFIDNGILVSPGNYTLKQKVVQPQSAMVVLDYKTGGIKAMIGGRNVEGRFLFNRATSPRQPGSAIKPMAVYGPALQSGANFDEIKGGEKSYGTYWTAASRINDEPMTFQGEIWPKNWYNSYRGVQTLRKSVEQSVNVNAVKVFLNIGAKKSLAFLKSMGVTTVVESGSINDMNPAALALGGMTRGISPLEMTAGYGTFANKGVYIAPSAYTKITNKRDELFFEKEPKSVQVMDPGAAFIMTDILSSTVSDGIASGANISSQPVAGKTGTTQDKYDAWFVGFTPQYSAAIWIGNDVNIELSEGSGAAAKVWSRIMSKVCAGLARGRFSEAPDNISTRVINGSETEYFIKGTESTNVSESATPVYLCSLSGYRATPYCPARKHEVYDGNGSSSGTLPAYFCHIHNMDVDAYPINPSEKLNTGFVWDGLLRDDAYYETHPEEEVKESAATENTTVANPSDADRPSGGAAPSSNGNSASGNNTGGNAASAGSAENNSGGGNGGSSGGSNSGGDNGDSSGENNSGDSDNSGSSESGDESSSVNETPPAENTEDPDSGPSPPDWLNVQ